EQHTAVAALLKFYQELARFQKSIYEKLATAPDHSLSVLLPYIPQLIGFVKKSGTPVLAQAADRLSADSQESWLELLGHVWQPKGAVQLTAEQAFFAQALLQPYAEYLASKAAPAAGPEQALCPFCGSRPQVAVLRPEGDGGRRSLMCSLCSTEWAFRRVACPSCGEENKDHLPVFIAKEFDYVRVDACDTCHTYIKSIDMTKNGRAVPMVDELATVSLNLWATENKYEKLSPNLFGV
ncbi:MAG TPA: formate dehydrogenase accessory protein FdhE, partial [Alphaproteobacteria bacterium]|nr:formate dehydrogenase accessory protein FdhE [Alphaproteobacteria bacterium]